jgi:zinc D-Ala-D-Ala dipeptidase
MYKWSIICAILIVFVTLSFHTILQIFTIGDTSSATSGSVRGPNTHSCSSDSTDSLSGPESDALPDGFSYLRKIDATIEQDIRYASYHNFIGKPVSGYNAAECILTTRAVHALSRVQQFLRASNSGLHLKVYDCFRPTISVKEFVEWSHDDADTVMKMEFYPKLSKSQLFPQGYIAATSGHSRGSTVDVTLVPNEMTSRSDTDNESSFRPGQVLTSCTAPVHERFRDNTINMGTGFDCFSPKAHTNCTDFPANVSHIIRNNRQFFARTMKDIGNFSNYHKEWWHYTLDDEPFPETYFSFTIEPIPTHAVGHQRSIDNEVESAVLAIAIAAMMIAIAFYTEYRWQQHSRKTDSHRV